MRAALAFVAALLPAVASAEADWILSSRDGRGVAGDVFTVTVVAPPGVVPPDVLDVRVTSGPTDLVLHLAADAPPSGARRDYSGTLPASAFGAANLSLANLPSNTLIVMVSRRDAVNALAGAAIADAEPPLSENEPVYFVAGTRDGVTARFQLSFKYRLFDTGSGYGHERPWLSALYFAYTQTSLWDLSHSSWFFRDTSYRPSLFWKWDAAGHQAGVDSVRLGVEHESNGRDGLRARSVNMLFLQPEWRWPVGHGRIDFFPRFVRYTNKEENPDIDRYRGPVDWHLRYDTGGSWVYSAMARTGYIGYGSLELDAARRLRDLKFGPVSTYLYLQYFNGYGEELVDYRLRRNSQLRIGFALVP